MSGTPANATANATMAKFGHPATLLRDYDHWVVLLRPAQPVLGALVLAAKGEATAFGDLPAGAHAELATVTRDIERALKAAVGYDRINYLMLMMVDPHVHFHILPRYEGEREAAGIAVTDAGWPGQPNLGQAVRLDEAQIDRLRAWIAPHFA
ncbi:HIT family protein [Sphingobium aquiterrae]|uniref:HIT family protein n=1 Tax=Sphingobium aquiterrae TaxID=2038656 RepID=UPI003015C336